MKESVFQKTGKLRSTGVRRVVVDVEKKIELWAVEVLSIKASDESESRAETVWR